MIIKRINPGTPNTATSKTETGFMGKWNPKKLPIKFRKSNPTRAITEFTRIFTIH